MLCQSLMKNSRLALMRNGIAYLMGRCFASQTCSAYRGQLYACQTCQSHMIHHQNHCTSHWHQKCCTCYHRQDCCACHCHAKGVYCLSIADAGKAYNRHLPSASTAACVLKPQTLPHCCKTTHLDQHVLAAHTSSIPERQAPLRSP